MYWCGYLYAQIKVYKIYACAWFESYFNCNKIDWTCLMIKFEMLSAQIQGIEDNNRGQHKTTCATKMQTWLLCNIWDIYVVPCSTAY